MVLTITSEMRMNSITQNKSLSVETDESQQIEYLSLDQLELRCLQETGKWRNKEPNDPEFCLEIFRRALQLARERSGDTPHFDEKARALVVKIYTPFIEAHINSRIRRLVELDEVTQEVWLRFWSAARSGLVFDKLPLALGYLRITTLTTIHRMVRIEGQRPGPLSDTYTGGNEPIAPDADVPAEHERKVLYERMLELIPDRQERLLFLMRYYQGLPPREMVRRLALSDQPLQVEEIYTILDRIKKRLAKDPTIRDLLQSD
jgi:DNA-directed RNA polymerase specialized sigma24 family protein